MSQMTTVFFCKHLKSEFISDPVTWHISSDAGTDTIGCIRIPASCCGILGFRPSHGIVSLVGVLPNSQSLDTVGM